MAGGLGIHRSPGESVRGVRVAEPGGPRGDASADVAANRQHVAEVLGTPSVELAVIDAEHGNTVHEVTEEAYYARWASATGLLPNQQGCTGCACSRLHTNRACRHQERSCGVVHWWLAGNCRRDSSGHNRQKCWDSSHQPSISAVVGPRSARTATRWIPIAPNS